MLMKKGSFVRSLARSFRRVDSVPRSLARTDKVIVMSVA